MAVEEKKLRRLTIKAYHMDYSCDGGSQRYYDRRQDDRV